MPVVSSGSLTITDLNDSVLLSLSLPSVSLPADAAGTVSSYSTAVTTARVMQGGVDVTSSWTLSKVDSSCTSTLSSGVVTVSAMSADSAYVDVTASRAGWPTLTARFALSKAKQGATGATGATGPAGAAGISTAVVYLYQRAASTPAVPSATLTWTFATNTLSGTLGAWTTAVPAGTNPLYVTVATAASAGATDTIGTAEWATPVILAQNGAAGATGATGATGAAGATGATGAAGATGATAATVYLFQRTASATAPALPSASVTYTFGSAVATGLTNGWTQTIPTTGGAYRWITTATALGTGTTDTIGTAEWAAAALMAQDGTGTNLIDTSTWQPGSTFPAGWSVWQDTPIAGNETAFVQAAGPTGQLTTVLECTADSANKLYTPQMPFSPLSFWFLDGATTTNIAPTVVVDTTNGWTADGSTTYSGNCFKITKASSTTASQGIVSRAVAVTPGETLRIRVRVRADAASTTGLYIRINQATSMPASGSVSASNRASSTDLAANVACTSTYTTYQNLTYVVPAGIVAISLCVFSHYNVSPASAGPLILYVDDPTINRAAYGDSATGPRQSAEGGWSPSPAVPINPTQTYRFVLPICRKTALYHHAYFGPLANQVCLLNTSTLATNSYFWGGDATSLTVDEWYLVVGYVYPAGSTGQTSDSAGVWRISTGQRVIAGTNVCWPAGATSVQTRAAQYYGDNGAKLQIGKPLMHVVDGSEPPLRSLFSDQTSLNSLQQWGEVLNTPYNSLTDSDSGTLGFNGAFLQWPAANALPSGYILYGTNSTITRDTSVVRDADGTPSIKFVVTGAACGIHHTASFVEGGVSQPLPAGSLLFGSVDIRITAITSGSPGVLVRLYTNLALTTYVDTVVTPDVAKLNTWQRLNWTARTTNLTDQIYAIQVFLMGCWVSMPGGAFTGTCYMENLAFEILDKSVDNKSMQFSEASGALTFTPSGNGTASFTAVTANNKVTSGNNSTYMSPGAIVAMGKTSVTSFQVWAGTTITAANRGGYIDGTGLANFGLTFNTVTAKTADIVVPAGAVNGSLSVISWSGGASNLEFYDLSVKPVVAGTEGAELLTFPGTPDGRTFWRCDPNWTFSEGTTISNDQTGNSVYDSIQASPYTPLTYTLTKSTGADQHGYSSESFSLPAAGTTLRIRGTFISGTTTASGHYLRFNWRSNAAGWNVQFPRFKVYKSLGSYSRSQVGAGLAVSVAVSISVRGSSTGLSPLTGYWLDCSNLYLVAVRTDLVPGNPGVLWARLSLAGMQTLGALETGSLPPLAWEGLGIHPVTTVFGSDMTTSANISLSDTLRSDMLSTSGPIAVYLAGTAVLRTSAGARVSSTFDLMNSLYLHMNAQVSFSEYKV